MLNKDAGIPIQGMPLGRATITGAYDVQATDSIVEFLDAGDVTCTLPNGTTTTVTVLAGSRYSVLKEQVTNIDFGGNFNIG